MVFVFVTLFSGGLARFCALLFSVRSVSVLFSSWWENLLCILDSKILPFKFVANISFHFRIKTVCRFCFSFEQLERNFSIPLLTLLLSFFLAEERAIYFKIFLQSLFIRTIFSVKVTTSFFGIFGSTQFDGVIWIEQLVGDWWLLMFVGLTQFPHFFTSSPSLSR